MQVQAALVPEQCQQCRSCVFNANFEQILDLVIVLVPLNSAKFA